MKRGLANPNPAAPGINTRSKPHVLWEAEIRCNYDTLQMPTHVRVSGKTDGLQGLEGKDTNSKRVNTDWLSLFGNAFEIIAFCLKHRRLSALTLLEIDKKQPKEMKQQHGL